MNWNSLIEDRNRFFWILHTAGWLGFAFIHFLGSLLHDLRDIFVIIIFLNAYAGWLLTIPLRYVYRKAWNLTPGKIVIVIIVCSYVVGVLWRVVANINYWEIYKHGFRPDFWLMYTQNSIWFFYIILSWSVLYFGIKYYQMLQKKSKMYYRPILLRIRRS